MGLTPPSPFEQCSKKLHFSYSKASLSTHTESPYLCLKVTIGDAIFRWKWHKMAKYTPYKWSLTGKDRFPKKYNKRSFLPIVASRGNTLLEKKRNFWRF